MIMGETLAHEQFSFRTFLSPPCPRLQLVFFSCFARRVCQSCAGGIIFMFYMACVCQSCTGCITFYVLHGVCLSVLYRLYLHLISVAATLHRFLPRLSKDKRRRTRRTNCESIDLCILLYLYHHFCCTHRALAWGYCCNTVRFFFALCCELTHANMPPRYRIGGAYESRQHSSTHGV